MSRQALSARADSLTGASRRLDWPRWGSLALSVLGAVDAAYLTWVKVAGQEAFCGASRACDTVQNSIYAELGGVPIAVLGLAAFMVIFGLLLAEKSGPLLAAWAPLAIFGMALTGTLYSAYLTYVELYILRAVCPYCVVSAVCLAGLLVLSIVRLARGLAE